jgi:hypothetical protein
MERGDLPWDVAKFKAIAPMSREREFVQNKGFNSKGDRRKKIPRSALAAIGAGQV